MTWGYVGAAAITVVGGYISQRKASKDRKEAMKAQNPNMPYQSEYATRLHTLITDPSSIEDTAAYKARMMGAARAMSAQGYTGSGNALVAAANAGGAAYQQAFQNLGAASGLGFAPGRGAMSAANQNAQDRSDLLNSAVFAGGRAWNAYSKSQSLPPISTDFGSPNISVQTPAYTMPNVQTPAPTMAPIGQL